MLNKETYAILKKEIEKDTLNENDLKNLNEDLSRLLIHLYLEKKYSKIKTEISYGKRFRNLFMKVVRDKISYYIGSFSCILNLFELLINRTNKHLSFREHMISLYAKANVKNIAEFLLDHPDSQHRVIAQNIDIDKGYLSHILKELQEAGCVERYGTGKRSFFSLSVQGRDYVKKQKQLNRVMLYNYLIKDDLFNNKYTIPKNTSLEETKYPNRFYILDTGNETELQPKTREVQYARAN